MNLIYLFIVLLIFFIIYKRSKKHNIYNNEKLEEKTVPKVVYCYWDTELDEFLKQCIKTWKFCNPSWKILIINKNTINQYLDVANLRHNDSPARLTDYLRLEILSKYGGVWMDISCWVTESFEWIHQIQSKYNPQVIGFRVPNKNCDIMESWFIACVKNSDFMMKWRNEFFRSNEFNSISSYVKSCAKTCINPSMQTYLAIHIAYNQVYQFENKNKCFTLESTDGPFKLHNQTNWNNKQFVQSFIEMKNSNKFQCKYFIKFRGIERKGVSQFFI